MSSGNERGRKTTVTKAIVDLDVHRWYAVVKYSDGSESIIASEEGIGLSEYDSYEEYEASV